VLLPAVPAGPERGDPPVVPARRDRCNRGLLRRNRYVLPPPARDVRWSRRCAT